MKPRIVFAVEEVEDDQGKIFFRAIARATFYGYTGECKNDGSMRAFEVIRAADREKTKAHALKNMIYRLELVVEEGKRAQKALKELEKEGLLENKT